MTTKKHETPNLKGLSETFEVEVDYDDPRLKQVRDARHDHVNPLLRVDDFPLCHRSGKHTVKCAWIPAHHFESGHSNQEVIAEIKRRGLLHPDRAITETVLDDCADELAENPSVGICGIIPTVWCHNQIVGCVYEHRDNGRHRHLSLLPYAGGFRHYRFLVVVPNDAVCSIE